MKLSEFDRMPPEEARQLLLTCCAAPRWADAVVVDRPYGSLERFHEVADELLTEADAMAGLAGHPRIGEARARLDGRSESEQGAVLDARADVLAALARGNDAYEQRFGHVYLVCASGRSAEELLAVLRDRLEHTAETERAVVRAELAAINRLRLGPTAGRGGGDVSLSTHVLDGAFGRPAGGVPVVLHRVEADGVSAAIAHARTDSDGRIGALVAELDAGTYRLTFDTGAYFAASGQRGFYPEVVVTFTVTDAGRHHHVPLLLSPFAYSTYLGS